MTENIKCGYVTVLKDGKITIPIESRQKHNITKGEKLQLILERIA